MGVYLGLVEGTIIDPIINIFEDSEGRNCMAINLGFSYYIKEDWTDAQEYLQIFKMYGRILSYFYDILGRDKVPSQFLYNGFCNRSSYVQKIHQDKQKKELGRVIPILALSNKEPLDEYSWANFSGSEVDSSLIYSYFPKKFITLPSMESFLIEIDPFFQETRKIKKTVLDLGIKFTRLQINEIAEKCGLKDEERIISTVKEMIKNKEIYAEYFSSSRAIAFDQRENIDEIDKLTEEYKEWEGKKVGKK